MDDYSVASNNAMKSFTIDLEDESENVTTGEQPSPSPSSLPSFSQALDLKPTETEIVHHRPEEDYCRSPADLIDVLSDIVDDIVQLTGLASLVAPLTDSDPHTECLQQSILAFLKHDLEDFLTEGNACDFTCGEDQQDCTEKALPAEIGAAGEPELEPLDDANSNIPELIPSVGNNSGVPVGFSKKNLPRKSKKKKKPKVANEEKEPEKPKKPCCRCTII